MKKPILLFSTMLLSFQLSLAQAVIRGKISLINNTFSPEYVYEDKKQPYVKNLSANLDRDKIILSYQLAKTTPEQYYLVRFSARIGEQKLPIQLEQLSGDYPVVLPFKGADRTFTTIWGDLISEYLDLEGELTIELDVQLKNNCPTSWPEWERGHARTHLWLAATGAASLGAGQIFRIQRDNKYEEYGQQTSLNDETRNLFQTAEDSHHAYLILSWAAVGILTADGVWAYIRSRRLKRQREIFNDCDAANSVSIRPAVLPGGGPTFAVGLQFNVQF